MKTIIWNILNTVAVLGFAAFFFYQIQKQETEILSGSADRNLVLKKIAVLEAKLDSVQSQNIGLGKSVIFLDSCQQVSGKKADRAERRGRFVGGLLKTLFPHF